MVTMFRNKKHKNIFINKNNLFKSNDMTTKIKNKLGVVLVLVIRLNRIFPDAFFRRFYEWGQFFKMASLVKERMLK